MATANKTNAPLTDEEIAAKAAEDAGNPIESTEPIPKKVYSLGEVRDAVWPAIEACSASEVQFKSQILAKFDEITRLLSLQ